MRSSGELHDWGMPCALTPAWHRRLRAAQRRSVLWRRTRAFRASSHGTHDALNVARTPRLKRTRTENGLARTEPSTKAAVPPACRYAYARMRTPRWQMPCSARKQLRGVCHAESVGRRRCIHESHERLNPSGRSCVAEEHYSVLQQRSGLRDDATNSVAHPLQQPIACCNSAQVCATTQPILLPIRCNSASRVATALSATTQNCCTRAQSVATAYRVLRQRSVRQRRTAARERSLLQRRMLQQRTILLQNRSTLHSLQRVATVQPAATDHSPGANLLQRVRRNATPMIPSQRVPQHRSTTGRLRSGAIVVLASHGQREALAPQCTGGSALD